jgi:WD40 repeat protein
MPSTVSCPSCKQTLRIPDTALGKAIRCPKCQTAFRTNPGAAPPPSAAVAAAPRPATVAPASPPAARQDPEDRIAASPGRASPPAPPASGRAEEAEGLPDAAFPSPTSESRQKGLTFGVVIKKDPEKRLKGRYLGWLSGEGLHLQQGKKGPIVLPRGEARYLGKNSLSVRHGDRRVELAVVKLAGYSNRLAEDVAAYLNGDMATLPVRSYALPWYLVTLVFLPAGIPFITLGGLVPGLLAGVAVGANLAIAQREKWPTALRAVLTLVVALLGYAGLAVFLWGVATHWTWTRDTSPGPQAGVGPAAVNPPNNPAGNPAVNPPKPREIPPVRWVEYRPAGGRCALLMPVGSFPQRQRLSGTNLEGQFHVGQVAGAAAKFLLGYVDLPRSEWERGPLAQRFDGIRQAMVAAERGGAVGEEKDVTLDNHPGRQFTIQSASNPGTVRLYAARPRLYLLQASGAELKPADAEKFFSSFRLDPPPEGVPPGVRFSGDAEGDFAALAFPADGSLWTAEEKGNLDHWDVETGRVKATLRVNLLGRLTAMAVAADGKTGVVGTDGQIRLLDLEAEKERGPVGGMGQPGHNSIFCLAFSPDGKTLASAHGLGEAKWWDVPTASFRKALPGHDGLIRALAFSPDGKWFAAGVKLVKLWDVGEGKEVASGVADEGGSGFGGSLAALAFSPDSTTLASAGNDGKVRLWDVKPFRVRTTLGAGKNLTSVAFSPDGRLLAAGSGDGMVRVWEVAGGKEVVRDTRKAGTTPEVITRVAFAPDGKTLAVTRGNHLEVWDLAQRIKP